MQYHFAENGSLGFHTVLTNKQSATRYRPVAPNREHNLSLKLVWLSEQLLNYDSIDCNYREPLPGIGSPAAKQICSYAGNKMTDSAIRLSAEWQNRYFQKRIQTIGEPYRDGGYSVPGTTAPKHQLRWKRNPTPTQKVKFVILRIKMPSNKGQTVCVCVCQKERERER